MTRLSAAKLQIERKLKDQERQHKKEQKQWDSQIKEKEEYMANLQKELKEKEQENRISRLKIKEMKRLIKHNQLKPISMLNSVEVDKKPDNSKKQRSPSLKKEPAQAPKKKGKKGWSLQDEMSKEPPKEVFLKLANNDLK
mmetsp:Transcript_16021/g.24858  ORF Transcript_16021/g.24858 Transcript_16021/m.24858 type:complete len:140 (-) Transcript_16021:17-436(-)